MEAPKSSEQSTSTKSHLSIQKQLSLAKYFYAAETQKLYWSNIIIEVCEKQMNASGQEGYQVWATNAATNKRIQCFM